MIEVSPGERYSDISELVSTIQRNTGKEIESINIQDGRLVRITFFKLPKYLYSAKTGETKLLEDEE